jgi:hypothetical protein
MARISREVSVGIWVIAALVAIPVLFWLALSGGLYVFAIQDHLIEIMLFFALLGLSLYALAQRYWV